MRAGILDSNQAREKRLAIQKESQLYGAMDGAMKFVKGDAIAGIVITIINVVGGIIIGMSYNGMTAYEATQTYLAALYRGWSRLPNSSAADFDYGRYRHHPRQQ